MLLARSVWVRALHENLRQSVLAIVDGVDVGSLGVDGVGLATHGIGDAHGCAWVGSQAFWRVVHRSCNVGVGPRSLSHRLRVWLRVRLTEVFAAHGRNDATVDVGIGAGGHVRVRGIHQLLAANLSLYPLVATLTVEGLLFALILRL